MISSLIFPIAASADGESESSNSDELFELELLLVIGGKSCQLYGGGCICPPGNDIGPNDERCFFQILQIWLLVILEIFT